VNVLERVLATYLADPAAAAQPFDGRAVPVVSVNQEIGERRKKDVFVEEPAAPAAAPGTKGGVAAAAAAAVAGLPVPSDDRTQELYAEALAKVPELAPLGPLLVSSKRFDLTEPEVRASWPSWREAWGAPADGSGGAAVLARVARVRPSTTCRW